MSETYGATVVEALFDYLEVEGVEYIFGVPGASLTPIYEGILERTRIKQVLAKHEQGAAFMAMGYARVSGKLGVCCATTGPGGTNALTGIAAAYADSIPVLLITGQAATQFFGKGAFQESTSFGIDFVQIYKPITKLSAMLQNSDCFPALFQQAFRAALTGRPGPVHLNLPADLLRESVATPKLVRASYRLGRGMVDREAAAKAAQVLLEAERPAILAGHGVTLSGAAEELLRLSDRLKIPVATTPKAKGVFPENHPMSLGVFGFAGHLLAEGYLQNTNVDVLLVLGTSMGEWSTNAWSSRLEPARGIIQIDIDARVIGRNYPVEVGVAGDVRAALAEVNQEVGAILALQGEAERTKDPLATMRDTVPRHVTPEQDDSDSSPIKPQHLILEMRRCMPDDALLFVDIGNAMTWAGHYFECPRPNTYFVAMGLSSMGSAVAGAIGGQLAAAETIVVALVGDSAFAMNGMEVHTAVENNVPVIWVVLNDGGHAMIMHGETLLLGRHLDACRFRAPLDVAGLGAALGARSFRVDSRLEFRDAFQTALEARAPCVIDAIIDPKEVPRTLARRVRTLAASFDHIPLSLRQPRR